MNAHSELLADAVRAAADAELAGAGEVRRINEELLAFPEARQWMQALAPGVLSALASAPAKADAPSSQAASADVAGDIADTAVEMQG